MSRIIIPTSADWETVNFSSGLLMVEGRLAELLLPEAWEGSVGAWSHDLDGHPYDYSGFGNHGTRVGGVSDHPEGWSFDGVNDYVDVGSSITHTSAMTVSGWFYLKDKSANQNLVSRRHTSDVNKRSWTLIFEDSPSSFRFATENGGTTVTTAGTTDPNVNTWYHVVATIDGADQRIYVNGTQEGQDTGNGMEDPGALSIFIANQPPSGIPANIIANDIRIYNRALTATIIQQLATNRGVAYEARLHPRYFVMGGVPWVYRRQLAKVGG